MNQNKHLLLKDISVVIPTYNRKTEVMNLVSQIPSEIGEVLIIDQSNTPIDFPKKSNIFIIHLTKPSITAARNFGVKHSTGQIICFIDDDVVLHLHNLERIKRKYERFIQTKHPELINEAAMYIMMHSCYDDFDFCNRVFQQP